MTIDNAITIFHGFECNPLFSEKHFKAFEIAIASLEALKEIRQEAMDAIEDGLYVRNTRILDIIDKHMKEVEHE